ncbi:phage tail tube protein [Pectinatus frisingensis]|uniref:phage tail tube protein n=1 Tax=Pectinatus frisingensis TaxID=865 RepID=UPI0018C4BAA8|nr:phage tail tube protein [Pectinatus frisingensis]
MLTDQELNNLPDNPNVSVAEAGKDTLLYLNKGTINAPDWLIIGGQRNTPLSRKANTLDASHKTSGGWGSTVPGLKSWSIDYSGLQIMSDEALQMIDYCFINDKQVHVKIAYKNGSYRTGWAYITEYNDDNAHDAIGTVKITLEGNGPISELITVATIDKTTAVFSKAAPADAVFTISPSTAEVNTVKNGGTALTGGTDYSYSSGTLTIKQSYLDAQSNGNVDLAVATDSTAFTLTITVNA